MLNLAAGWADEGHRVDLVLCQATGSLRDQVPSDVAIVELRRSAGWLGRAYALAADPRAFLTLLLPIILPYKPHQTARYLPDLVRYLQRERPTALVSAMRLYNLAALWARRLAGVSTRIVISDHTHTSTALQDPNRRRKWRRRFIVPVMQRTYPWADVRICVSNSIADDLSRIARLPRERITTIYNPVVTPALQAKARAPLDHAWFQPSAPPVVLGIGRLVPQKDFPTLLRAFARVRTERPARLMILGEGEIRVELEALARTLGVASDVAMPGFVENPYAYLARAGVFTLSSASEGLPTVLIEALACGCPVVSTDCQSGPAEILDGGTYGRLAPVGNAAAIAHAVSETLDDPPPRGRLQDWARNFSADRAIKQYRQVLDRKVG